MGAVRRAWDDLWDRFSASDPGLIRLSSALNTVCGILLTLLVLAVAHTAVPLLVTGAMTAMVAAFAISDSRPRDQAVTLGLGFLAALAAVGLGAELYRYRVASDLVFLGLIFAAVYVRRFGPRGTGLGMIGFQLFFVSQFTHAAPSTLLKMYEVMAVAFAASAAVRFGLVRATPERTLHRLRRAFRARLAALVDVLVEIAGAEPGSRADVQAIDLLHTRVARLHQCALMIQSRLEHGTADPRTASLIQRRIAEAEIAAERLGLLLLRAVRLGPDLAATDVTLSLHLSTLLPASVPADPEAAPGAEGAAADRLVRELRELRLLVVRATPGTLAPGAAEVGERMLGYRDDEALPEGTPAVQDVYRGLGDLARAMLGLRLTLEEEPAASEDDSPETARSREELEAEDISLQADEDVSHEPTGIDRPTTRAAFQVTVGSALAILGGELLSAQRWYWAVLTCWVVFLNTSSTGEILMKGYRRLAGTIGGVVAGIGLAALVGGHTWSAFALVVLCIFGMFFTAPLSYMLMSFFVTTMLGLLYTLLHTYSASVLLLRIEETLLGAVCGLIAAVAILPVRTRRRTDDLLVDVLEKLRGTLEQTVAALSGGRPGDLLDAARELDTALDTLRGSVQPLTHPASPLRSRRRRAGYILGLLETCAYHARSLAATAGFVPSALHADPRLADAGRQLDANLEVLADFVRSGGKSRGRLDGSALAPRPDQPPVVPAASTTPTTPTLPAVPAVPTLPAVPVRNDPLVTVRVLRHLQRLNESILGLGRPLGLGPAERSVPPR
ncbi:FUSC family protein [Streptacidiphilus albus]|uniref:FUSC family protein n=1 Tax=Streptacidiphilus albus TaxID=105425 RepID=UPI00054B5424|nr:FUSC family protein [Streptacidiphilus albus]